jgi:hypothetical protein
MYSWAQDQALPPASRLSCHPTLAALFLAYPLAWGLDEITAYGLLKDVSESLALTVVTF